MTDTVVDRNLQTARFHEPEIPDNLWSIKRFVLANDIALYCEAGYWAWRDELCALSYARGLPIGSEIDEGYLQLTFVLELLEETYREYAG
jgi:hypothetical protein